MRMAACAAALAALVVSVQGEEKASVAQTPMTGDVEKVSYAVGLNVGEMLVAQQTEIDFASFTAGVSDRLKNAKPRISQQEALEVLVKEKQRYATRMQREAEKNHANGAAFLEKNKSKKGVTVTQSGLQYEVVKEGAGPRPSMFDTVTFHCKSMFLDGTEFDNTRTKGIPTTHELLKLFRGWQEGMQLMKCGSVYTFFLPPEMAYGKAGNPYLRIGPDTTLIFEIELLSTTNQPPASATLPPAVSNVPPAPVGTP